MPDQFDFDFIVIGSGFGGSVSSHRLTEKGYRVGVMEMGKRWQPEDFPESNCFLKMLNPISMAKSTTILLVMQDYDCRSH